MGAAAAGAGLTPRGVNTTADSLAWQRVKPLLARLLERPAAERGEALEAMCGDDAALREQLRSLLAAAEADDALLRQLPDAARDDALDSRSEVGQRIGAWRLLALIARGGQGEVYRAERADGQFDQQVAIKLLRRGFDAEWPTSRFAAERQILARLDHPNLARLLDGGTSDDGTPYIVMELVDGEPIDRYCERRGLGLTERLKLFRTVCQVVGHAHGQRIVHRDLKCENVLVTADGTVKLVDFGIAKQLGAETEATATALRMMTLAYSSPEQVRGEPATPASDVYSLGVVLHRLLTGRSPYDAAGGDATDSGYDLARAICEREPPPPSRAVGTPRSGAERAWQRRLRGDLDTVVAMAMRKEPQRRYADAVALGDDIFRHLEHLPVRARRGRLGYRAQRFLLRHRGIVVAAAVANVVLAGGLAFAVVQGLEAQRQRQRAERSAAELRAMASVMLFDFHDAVAPLTGSLPARKLLVEKAVAYLERLAAEAGDDRPLRRELADGWRKVGDLQGAPNLPNIGDTPGALASYDHAIELLRPLQRDASGRPDADAAAALAAALGRKASVLGRMARFEEAIALHREALAIARPLLDATPDDVALLLMVSGIEGSDSWLRHERGDREGFLAASERSEALLARVMQVSPGNTEAPWRLAVVHARRGVQDLGEAGAPETTRRALDHFERWRDLVAGLVQREPENPKFVSAWLESRSYIGQALLRLGEPAAAAEALQSAVAEAERLMAREPQNDKVRGQLIGMRASLARAALAAGQPQAVIEQARLAAADQAQLAPASRGNIYFTHSTAHAQYLAGLAFARQAEAAGRGAARREQLQAQSCDALRGSLRLLEGAGTLPRSSEAELPLQTVRDAAGACIR